MKTIGVFLVDLAELAAITRNVDSQQRALLELEEAPAAGMQPRRTGGDLLPVPPLAATGQVTFIVTHRGSATSGQQC
jgi:hypothetical protein